VPLADFPQVHVRLLAEMYPPGSPGPLCFCIRARRRFAARPPATTSADRLLAEGTAHPATLTAPATVPE
jgi:hypothetical protein